MAYVGEYVGTIPTNGVYYKFENNGTDTFGHANATAYGGSNYSVGKMGQYCAVGDNATKYHAFTPGSTSTQFSTLTVMAWVNAGTTDDGCIIQSLVFSTTYRGWFLRCTGDGSMTFATGNATTSSMATMATNSTSVCNNTWNHIAVTISGTSVNMYVNGALDKSATIGQAISTSGTHHGRMGVFYNGSTTTYWLAGAEDDVIVFDSVKSAAFIRDYYWWAKGKFDPTPASDGGY